MFASIPTQASAPHQNQAAAEYPLLYRNMLAVTLLGAIHKTREDVDKARKAVERTLGDPRLFRVYLAMAQSIGGHGKEAATALARHLEQHPDDERAQLALAMALMLSGDAKWREVLQGLLAASDDQGVREAANGLLDSY
jgi:Flp pilus assembly protein TadD